MTSFLQKIFGHPKPQSASEPSKPSPEELTLEIPKPENNHYEPPQLIVGCAQSVGKQRDHNEDALFTLTSNLASNQNLMPLGLYIVADGMGGHQHGEVASEIAIRAMSSHVVRKLFTPLFSLQPAFPEESIQEIMRDGVQEAHQAIIRDAPGGGTTLTAVLILGEQLTIAHVGDSRAYLLTGEGAQVLTRDHSLVRRLEELGQITAEEAAIHPQRNVLYRALGQGEPFDPDVTTSPLPADGHLLVCSDGLWGVVSEKEISHMVSDTPNPQKACQDLVNAANDAGGPDNITAILVRMPD